jgi:hypothetical protein
MLAMAKDYLDNAWTMNMEFTQKMFEEGKKTAEELQEAMKPYSMDELTEKAKELYSFVSKKD